MDSLNALRSLLALDALYALISGVAFFAFFALWPLDTLDALRPFRALLALRSLRPLLALLALRALNRPHVEPIIGLILFVYHAYINVVGLCITHCISLPCNGAVGIGEVIECVHMADNHKGRSIRAGIAFLAFFALDALNTLRPGLSLRPLHSLDALRPGLSGVTFFSFLSLDALDALDALLPLRALDSLDALRADLALVAFLAFLALYALLSLRPLLTLFTLHSGRDTEIEYHGVAAPRVGDGGRAPRGESDNIAHREIDIGRVKLYFRKRHGLAVEILSGDSQCDFRSVLESGNLHSLRIDRVVVEPFFQVFDFLQYRPIFIVSRVIFSHLLPP